MHYHNYEGLVIQAAAELIYFWCGLQLFRLPEKLNCVGIVFPERDFFYIYARYKKTKVMKEMQSLLE